MVSEPTPQQLITQSVQATANAIVSALTARMASISLPIYDWDSKNAYHSFSIFCHTPGELAPPQLHPTRQQGSAQIHFCSPGKQIPRDACTMDAYRQLGETESNQDKSFCLPQPNPTGNDTQHQHPCAPWRT